MQGELCHNRARAMLNQEVITEAETAAIQIPAGNAVLLPEGSRIYVTQMLGNSITAATDVGLVRISREEGNPSQKELAEKMELSTAAVAVSLKKLETGGYVARCADTDDSRINRVTVTEKGRLTVKKSHALFDALDTEMFAGVSEEEIDLCMTTMEKLMTNMKNALGVEQE